MTLEEYNREQTILALSSACLKAASRYRANYGAWIADGRMSAGKRYETAAMCITYVELIPTYGWPTERVEPIRERQP